MRDVITVAGKSILPKGAKALYTIAAGSNLTLVGNTTSCAEIRNGSTVAGSSGGGNTCIIHGGFVARLFTTSGAATTAAPTYISFLNLTLSGGMAKYSTPGNAMGGGALLALDNTVLVLDGCTFTNNRAALTSSAPPSSQLHGGAVYLSQPLSVLATRSVFSGNNATSGVGGAMYVDQSTSASVINLSFTIFSLNRGASGGGLAFDSVAPGTKAQNSFVTLHACGFSNNFATYDGGAILSGSVYSFSDMSGSYRQNVASKGIGGAIAANYYAASFLFRGSVFDGNGASDEGGAMGFVDISGVLGSGLIQVFADGVVWANNTVQRGVAGGGTGNGGGMSLSCFALRGNQNKCAFNVTLRNSVLSSNVAKGAGGGVYVSPGVAVSMTNVTLSNNSALGAYARGGGLATENVLAVTLINSVVSVNFVNVTIPADPSVGQPTVAYAGAGLGGGIYAASLSSAWAPTPNLKAARLAMANMSISFSSFSRNSAPAGGGCAMSGYATVVTSSIFDGNGATGSSSVGIDGDGGGLLVFSYGATAVVSTTFTENTAAGRGGACAGKLSPTSLLGNSTAIATGETGHTLSIAGGTVFNGNAAYLGGGALFLETTPAFTSAGATRVVSYRDVSAINNTALAGAVIYTANCSYTKAGTVVFCAPFSLPLCNGACAGFTNGTAARAGNKVQSHGPFSASAPAAFTLSIGATTSAAGAVASVPSGLPWTAPLYAVLSDFYSQTITAWDDGSGAGGVVFVAALAPRSDAFAQGAAQLQGSMQTIAVPLTGTSDGWIGLQATGFELANATLVVTAPNYIFPTPRTRSANISIQIAVCGPGTKAQGSTCACVANAVTAPTSTAPTRCICLPSYFLNPPEELATSVYAGVRDMSWNCGTCPPGASCAGDGLFLGKEGYWHLPPRSASSPGRRMLLSGTVNTTAIPTTLTPSAEFFLDTTFYDCRVGLCFAMSPDWKVNNLSAPQPVCRDGHTGPLCEVCELGYSYSGQFCTECPPGDAYAAWSRPRRVTLAIMVSVGAVIAVIFLFFWPLLPNLQTGVFTIARTLSDPTAVMMEADRRMQLLRTGGHTASTNDASALPLGGSVRIQVPRLFGEFLSSRITGGGAELKEKLRKLARDAAAPLKMLFVFVQLVVSFSHSLSVPWPHTYNAISSRLNFVALDFFAMPSAACVNPGITFFTKFMGETIGLTAAIGCIGAIYVIGRAMLPMLRFGGRHDSVQSRKRRLVYFQATCLSRLLLLLYLVYPNISKVIVDMFACRRVADVNYLMADFRIVCSGPAYNRYFSAAIFWTIVYPLGIPVCLLILLLSHDVPRVASRRIQSAWLDAALREVWRIAALECDAARQLRTAVGVDEALTVTTLTEVRAAQLLDDFRAAAFDESALADSEHLEHESNALAAQMLAGAHPDSHNLSVHEEATTPANITVSAPKDEKRGHPHHVARVKHQVARTSRSVAHATAHSGALVVLSVSSIVHAVAAPLLAASKRIHAIIEEFQAAGDAAKQHLAALRAKRSRPRDQAGGDAVPDASPRKNVHGPEIQSSPAQLPTQLPPGWATAGFEERHRDTLALAAEARLSGSVSVIEPVWRTASQTEEAMLFAIGRLAVALSRADPSLVSELSQQEVVSQSSVPHDDTPSTVSSSKVAIATRAVRSIFKQAPKPSLNPLDYIHKLMAIRKQRLEEMEAAHQGNEDSDDSSDASDNDADADNSRQGAEEIRVEETKDEDNIMKTTTDLLVFIRASDLKRCLAAVAATVARFDAADDEAHAVLSAKLQEDAELRFQQRRPPNLLFGLMPPPPPQASVPPRPPRGPAGGMRAVAGFLEEVLLLYEEGVAVQRLPFLLSSYKCACWYWELVELLRRALLTVVLAFVAPRTATQVTVGIVIAFAMLVLLGLAKPYAVPGNQRTAYIAQVELFLFLFVALLLKVNVGSDTNNGNDGPAFNAIVTILSLFVLAIPFINKALHIEIKGDIGAELKDASAEAKESGNAAFTGLKADLCRTRDDKAPAAATGSAENEGEEEEEEEEEEETGEHQKFKKRSASFKVDAAVAALEKKFGNI